ncbi:MAG: CHASE2 domain-containing protein [Candidatus Wallbacteria bacterium]|nr:CHASE2 domain-containing protein [Candidatus Wallbacteria bacterium]
MTRIWKRLSAAAACFALAALAGREVDSRLDAWAYDRALSAVLPRAAKRGETLVRAAGARVLVVDVSDPRSAGEGIVDRRQLAQVVRRLTAMGAQVVALDIRLEDATDSSSDAELTAALQACPGAVIAAWVPADGAPVRLSRFASEGVASGVVNLPLDPRDGYLRAISHQFAHPRGAEWLPSLALATLARALSLPGEPPAVIVARPGELVVTGSLGERRLPVGSWGRGLLPYRGPSNSVPILRHQYLLALPPGVLDLGGKIVYVGNARVDIRDSYLTPFHRGPAARLSGVEIQAQALQGHLDGERWRTLEGGSAWAGPAVGAAAGVALAAALSPPVALGVSAVIVLLVFELSLAIFEAQGLLIDPFGVAAALVLGSVVWGLYRYRQEAQVKRGLQALLAAYFRSSGTMTLAGAPKLPEQAATETTMARLMEARDVLAPAGIEILEPLGAGGMSFVLKGRTRDSGRLVALKLLSPDLFRDADGRARFSQEERLAAALAHPNVVGVVRAGDEKGIPYIAYEYVEGPTLRKWLEVRGRLPAGEAVRLVRQMLAGLAHAHALGIVHRDIKPENTLLAGGTTARLLDFGIARSDTPQDSLRTRTGMLLGTPTYMAPELLRDVRASAASDLYSIGCVLYELLSGRPPFTGESPSAILIAHLEKPVTPLAELSVELPVGLWEAIASTLEKDPAGRPVSAAALSAMLAPFDSEESSDMVEPVEPSSRSEPTIVSSASLPAAKPGSAPTLRARREPGEP